MKKYGLFWIIVLYASAVSYANTKHNFTEIPDNEIEKAVHNIIDRAETLQGSSLPCTFDLINTIRENKPKMVNYFPEGSEEQPYFLFDHYEANIESYQNSFFPELTIADSLVDKGVFNTLMDKGLHDFLNTESYIDFSRQFTGLDQGEIDSKIAQEELSDDFKIKLAKFYRAMKASTAERKMHLGNFKSKSDKCNINTDVFIEMLSWDYPIASFKLTIEVDVKCDCGEESSTTDLEKGRVIYQGNISGPLTANNWVIGTAQNSGYSIEYIDCCTPPKEAPSSTGPSSRPTRRSSTKGAFLLPKNRLGAAVGFAYSDKREEFSVCAGMDYAYQVAPRTYAGVKVAYSFSDGEQSQDNTFDAGAYIEYLFKLLNIPNAYILGGLRGNGFWGSEDNNGFVEDVSGYKISLNTGVQLQLSERFSIGLRVPIANYRSTTYTPEGGGPDFKEDNFSFKLNKRSRAMISAQWRLAK